MAHSPGTPTQPIPLSPAMRSLLAEALGAWSEQFDGPDDRDLSVSGADLVEWFAEWRLRVRTELAAHSEA